MVQENRKLPWDVLDIISKTLDFVDHFQFAGVCKNWRTFHKIYSRNFLASQEPLLLQISCHPKGSFSFISIPNQKVYCSKMGKYFFHSAYVTISSGYFIMARYNDNSFMLMSAYSSYLEMKVSCCFILYI
ncbi:putative F-box domain-containing protein [Medicago truncatula]|uniref:Putative F-box domain-containing protein n=1 Tax=Medicago truncatula TaxID=3880 RepID=A0A396JV29_MEDTR|nr:putative F-box domain-containing protein [Medicago truncatula]